MDNNPTITEVEVRKLRAIVYGECSDDNWSNCRENWMKPDSTEYLKKHSKMILGNPRP